MSYQVSDSVRTASTLSADQLQSAGDYLGHDFLGDENFLQPYHHLTFLAQGTYGEKVQGDDLLLENPSIDLEVIPPFWVACILPDALFALISNDDISCAIWCQLDIKGQDLFEFPIHIQVHESIAASTTAIHLEDTPMCEGVRKGVSSRFCKPGRLSHLEECLWQFHRYPSNSTAQCLADQEKSGAKL